MPSTQDLPSDDTVLHRISIVIPVYRGEITLPALIQEFVPMLNEQVTPD